MPKTLMLVSLLLMIFAGCASTVPPKIYLPLQNSETTAYYRNGLPIAATQTANSLLMTSLEPDNVSGKGYMRLWFLYKNTTDSAYLLEPLKIITLTIEGEKHNYSDIVPESPAKLLAGIENEKASKLIFQAIGGTLEALSTEPTTVTDPAGGEWKVNDKGAKTRAVVSNTMESMAHTSNLYDVFKTSINSGILRRNTLFAGQSVNGYIYFPLPKKIPAPNNNNVDINPEKHTFVFTISSQAGNEIIEFSPAEGE